MQELLRRRRGRRRSLRLRRSTAPIRGPIPRRASSRTACTGRRRSSTPRLPLAARQLDGVAPRRPRDLRAARRHVHSPRAPSPAARQRLPELARSRRHRDRADAGRRVRRRAQLGLRRRRPVRAVAELRPARRSARLRRRGARARPRRASSTSSTTTSARKARTCRSSTRTYLTDRHATPWGGGDQSGRPGLATPCAASSSTTRCTGCASTTSTACGSTRRTRSLDDSRAHIVAELAAAVRSAAGLAGGASIAEDHRNLARARSNRAERGGWGLDGVWADDFHHVLRRRLAGDSARLLPGLHRLDRRAGADAAGRAGSSPASTRAHGDARARHRSVDDADAPLRRLPAESRSGRQSRDRRSPAPRDRRRGVAGGEHAAADRRR